MPLPVPHAEENKDDFLDRCMSDEMMVKEYPSEKQRYAVCNSLWKEKKEIGAMEDRSAIAVHHTPTSDAPWDGPANVARLRNDGDAPYYRRMFAWVDPDLDPDTKRAYKFPHHEVSGDGEIGAANIRGCQAAIAVLNGARGGADIPDSDRPGVYRHLSAHLKDADVEPAPLRSLFDSELRAFDKGELRISPVSGGLGTLHGIPGIPFNSWSEDLGGFIERITPQAVEHALGKYDIVCCRDHEPSLVLGRESSGNLRLECTDEGLDYHVDLPDTSYARDLVVSIERGDVRGSSFMFRVLKDGWYSGSDGLDRREVYEMELYEVGPVTMPAYPQTTLKLRSLESIGIDYQLLSVALARARTGQLEQRHIDIITSAIEVLRQYLPSDAVESAEDTDDLALDRVRIRKCLEIIKRKI